MGDSQDHEEGEGGAEKKVSALSSIPESDSEEDQEPSFLHRILPCLRSKGPVEPSKGDVFKSNDSAEANYPRSLKILEHKFFHIMFIGSCATSIFLFLFSEGFFLESRALWAIMLIVNAIYAIGLFAQWLRILLKSKYSKTHHGYTNNDIVYSLASVFPADLIVVTIYILNDEDDNEDIEGNNPIEHWMITISRLNYFIRIRSILQYLTEWEDNLVMGDYPMFLLKLGIYTTFLIHLFACVWNRLACSSFRLKHFMMTSDEARIDVCEEESWVGSLQNSGPNPLLLDHPTWHILISQYVLALYWAIFASFRLGAGDISTTVTKNPEVIFVILVEILSWIYVLVNISGLLSSLLIEKDTEKENFLTRVIAIKHYLRFTEVAQSVQQEVYRYYDYLWQKCSGIVHVDLVDVMPGAMKSEVYYDVNKFVMDQMPMLKGMDVALHMALSVYTEHKFFLQGEYLFRRGETATDMIYLVKGYLEVLTDDDNHTLTTIRSGSIVGEVHLLQPYPHIATVKCGVDCDVLVLSRDNFRKVITAYPQYQPVMELRLENRLEQSGLLLALCEKHNTYRKALKALKEADEIERLRKEGLEPPPPEDRVEEAVEETNLNKRISFEKVTNILHAGGAFEHKSLRGTDDDFDYLEIGNELEAKLQGDYGGDQGDVKSLDETLQAACAALEADVHRAGSLATDLNIPRPPLTVRAPEQLSGMSMMTFGKKKGDGEEQEDRPNCIVMIYKSLKNANKKASASGFLWDTMVAVFTCAVVWYYPYQFAFRNDSQLIDYIFHVTDVVFALDCFYDMIQIVVTPQKTFESFSDIFNYRIRSLYFYLRIFSWVPFEYIFAYPIGIKPPYYYLFKFNRLYQFHQVMPYVDQLQTRFKCFTPIYRSFILLTCGICYMSHFGTVGYKWVLRDIVGHSREQDTYLDCFYRGIVTTTTTGYGDVKAIHDFEIGVDIIGLIFGVSLMIFLQAKVTTMIVNYERQRVYFHGVYYGIAEFMSKRKFPSSLRRRIYHYYDLQWQAHDGTLPPIIQDTIKDAPDSTLAKVAICVGQRYLKRIPIFMECPIELQGEFCKALNHYLIPPGEVLLYADEIVRDLYIIAKGYVEVIHREKVIGVFGKGRYVGLGGLLTGINTGFLFRTTTYCQVLCLTYENFQQVMASNTHFSIEFSQLEAEVNGKIIEPPPTHHKHHHHHPPEPPPVPSKDRLMYPHPKYLDYVVKVSPYFEDDDAGMDLMEASEAPPEPPQDDNPDNPTKSPKLKPKKMKRKKKKKGVLSGIIMSISNFSCKTFHFKPNSSTLKSWTVFRLFCAMCATIFAPMQLTFPLDPLVSFIVTIILDVFAWIGMWVSSRTAYMGESNQLITDPTEMACHYLKGNFMLDFLASVPADHIAFLVLRRKKHFDNKYHFVSLLRMNRMLQCFQFNMFKQQFLETSIFASLTFVMFLELLPIMWIALNVLTFASIVPLCGYTTDGKPSDCVMTDSWLMNGVRDLGYITPDQGLYDQPDMSIPYIIGLYWVTQTISGIGFGDIALNDNQSNRALAIFGILTGTFIMTYVSAKLTSCVAGDNEQKMELEEKMVLMSEYLDQHNVSRSCRRRVNEIYLNIWNKTKGISPREMFAALPPGLKTDVMRQLYGNQFRTSPLFEKLDTPGLRMLTGTLKEAFFSEGEYLMRYGDLCNEVIYISNGVVICYNVRGDVMAQLGAGSLIGEIASFFQAQRLYTAMAVQEVNAFVFTKDEFMAFLNNYPDIKATVETCSVRHYREAMQGTKMGRQMEMEIRLTLQNEKTGKGGGGSALGSLADSTVDKTRNKIVDAEESNKAPDEFENKDAPKWWAVFVTFGAGMRDDMGLVHIFNDLDKCNIFNFAVHPASPCCGWMDFCLVLTAISCSITCYDVAFSYMQKNTVNYPMTILRYFIEIFYWTRFLGNFHLAYYDESLALITDVRLITKKYALRSDGLWLDIVTCVPFYILANWIPGVSSEGLRALQVLRIILFLGYLGDSDSGLSPGSSAATKKIMKITILLTFIFHFYACVWYTVACTDVCVTGSWMDTVINTYRTVRNDPEFEVDTMSRYMLALYYVTNALTYTGFSEVTGHTKVELIMNLVMVFMTIFVIGYLVGEMVMCLSSQVAYKIQYQHKITVLEEHFMTLGISTKRIGEVRRYFRLFWCRSKGMQFSALFDEMPYTLKADLQFEIYGHNLRSSRILGKLDDTMMRQICAHIRHELYFPGSHIVRAGDAVDAMYFIKKGEVVTLDGNSNVKLCVEILYENDNFGEVKILLPREQYRFFYVARLETEVGILDKADLIEVLKHNPKVFEELKERANKLKVKRQSMKEEENKEKGGGGPGAGSSMSIKSITSGGK